MLTLATCEALLVNVTAWDRALGIQLHWGPGVPLTLSLGYGYHPNETSYDAQTHLPPVAATGSQLPGLVFERLPSLFKLKCQRKSKGQGWGDGSVIKV